MRYQKFKIPTISICLRSRYRHSIPHSIGAFRCFIPVKPSRSSHWERLDKLKNNGIRICSYLFERRRRSRDEAEEQEDDHGEKAEAVNLVKSLMNLSHIKCFRFICDAKLLKLPYNLPTGHQFVHLKELSMILDFLDAEMVSLLLFLLRSCPNLQELALEGKCLNEHIPIEIDFWEKQRPPDCFINPLLRVYMHEISLSRKSVIGFVKFLLLNAHVLIGMTLDYIETP
ncbi:hypothetical protein AAC387_Pa12g2222 [Persea americana]